MNRLIVISGCSGGGKSSLLQELGLRGHQTVEEPGRRIVADQMKGDGSGLPWVNMAAFASLAMKRSLEDLENARRLQGFIFFDRGLVDAASALLASSASETDRKMAVEICKRYRYHHTVFMTPPWPEIYRTDSERKHEFVSAVEEYDRLCAFYPLLGYQLNILPQSSICERADFILSSL